MRKRQHEMCRSWRVPLVDGAATRAQNFDEVRTPGDPPKEIEGHRLGGIDQLLVIVDSPPSLFACVFRSRRPVRAPATSESQDVTSQPPRQSPEQVGMRTRRERARRGFHGRRPDT